MRKTLIFLFIFIGLLSCKNDYESILPTNLERAAIEPNPGIQIHKKITKEQYYQFSEYTFRDVRGIMDLMISWGCYTWEQPFINEVAYYYFMNISEYNNPEEMYQLFLTELNGWESGEYQSNFVEPSDNVKNTLNDMFTEFDKIPYENTDEHLIFLDTWFNNIYYDGNYLTSIEKDIILSTIMFTRGNFLLWNDYSIFLENGGTDWPNWKKIGKCLTGAVGGYYAGALGGLTVGAGVVGALTTASIVLSGGTVGIIIVGVAAAGAIGGAATGAISVGGCFD